jgi:hypothetical protein
MKPKVWTKLGVSFSVVAILLFGPAGRLGWPAAWVLLVLFFAPFS